ncbi:MAG: hypothetical protein Q9207_003442 [Kuettlingeria erythrocarpa]
MATNTARANHRPKDAQERPRKAAIPLELISHLLNTSTSDLSSDLVKKVYAPDFPTLVCKGDEIIKTEPTGGRYRNSYIAAGENFMIICHSSFSPRQQAREGQPWPKLYRWSDIVWLAWAQLAGGQKSQLRYIVHDDIVTPATRKWMEYIEVASPDTDFLPWPGQLYDLQSDEGKAMLATPHGVGLAYMLADHSHVLAFHEQLFYDVAIERCGGGRDRN